MKQSRFFIYLVASTAALFSCAKEQDVKESFRPIKDYVEVAFTAETAPVTKVSLTPSSDDASFTAAWVNEDEMTVDYEWYVYDPDDLGDGSVIAEYDGTDFNMSLPNITGDWSYYGFYPAKTDISFPATRKQVGATFNGKYDVMYGTTCTSHTAPGLDENNQKIVIPMDRFTAIQYFHFTSALENEEVLSATLTVDSGADIIAAETVSFVWENNKWTLKPNQGVETSRSITISFDEGSRQSATDFKLWFSVLPAGYTSMSLTIVTTSHTKTITREKANEVFAFEAGKLYKVSGVALSNWSDVGDPHANQNGWFLIKDANYLHSGDVIRIASTANNAVAGLKGSNDYLTKATAQFDITAEKMTGVGPGYVDITLGGTSNSWTLHSSEGYYGSSAVKKLVVDAEPETWSISITDEGVATIVPNDVNTSKLLYNVNNPRFLNYASDPTTSMVLPEIYKKYGNPQDANVKQDQNLSFSPTSATATISKPFTEPTLNGVLSTGAKTWDSSDKTVATVDNDGKVSLISEGVTTISVIVAADEEYNEATASYTLTVNPAPVVTGGVWTEVTDISTLKDGMQIVITNANASYALSTTQYTNNRKAVAVTAATGGITIDSEVQILTLEKDESIWYLKVEENQYLYAASSTNNYLRTNTKTSAGDNGKWAITRSENITRIVAQGDNSRNVMQYNPNQGNPIFTCYGSASQTAVAIYTLDETTWNLNKIEVTTQPTKKNYYVGETFDPTDMVVTATYVDADNSEHTKTAEVTNYTFSPNGPLALADDSVTVSYTEENITKTAVVDISVYELEEITASGLPQDFVVGSDFSFGSGSVTAHYTDGSTKSLTLSEVTVEGFDSTVATTGQIVTIKYTDNNVTKSVQVVVNIVSSQKHVAIINFNNTQNGTAINSASVTGSDSEGNEWTVSTAGTTSFTANSAYYQVGSSKKPATSITFTTTLKKAASDISLEAKLGGFSDTAGTVNLMVGDNSIGTGSLNASNDVVVTSSSSGSGTVLTVTVTGIAKGVKVYYIKATYTN